MMVFLTIKTKMAMVFMIILTAMTITMVSPMIRKNLSLKNLTRIMMEFQII